MNLKFILFCTLCWFSSLLISATITVNQDGTADYTQINLAIEASTDGDTIKVFPGTYEGNILLEDRHNLLIASLYHWTEIDSFKCNTIIDGEMENFGIKMILASNITFQGFTIRNCVGAPGFYSGAGFYIERSSQIKIYDDYITNNFASFGAGILADSNYPEIENSIELVNCTISENYASYGAGLIVGGYTSASLEENNSNSIYSNYASWGADIFWHSRFPTTIYLDTLSIDFEDNNFNPYYFYDHRDNCELNVSNHNFELIDRDIYVNAENGNNENPGTENEPMQTITHALSRIRGNENDINTIFVQPGHYTNEGSSLPFKSYVNLIGTDMNGVVLDFIDNPIFTKFIYGANDFILMENEIANLEIININYPRLVLVGLSHSNKIYFKNIRSLNISGGSSLFKLWYKYDIDSKVSLENVSIDNFNNIELVYNTSQNLDIINCSFKNSEYTYWGEGGGKSLLNLMGYVYDPIHPIINIVNTEISNNEAANNWPGEMGTDTAISTGPMTNVNIINSTISNNRAVPSYYHPSGEYGRAIQFWEQDSHVNIVNSIIYGNDEFDIGYKDPGFYEQNSNYSLNVVNSVVGNHEMDLNDNQINFYDIWDDDPEFAGDEAEYPFALLENSYAIDAGLMNYLDYLPEGFEFPTTDLAGNPRISGDVIDLGAYEYQHLGSAPEEEEYIVPIETTINNYPNPGRISTRGKAITKISLNLAEDGNYKLDIYNIKGQKVRSILNAFLAKGNHSYSWHFKDSNNKSVTSGTYLIKCELDGYVVATSKITIVK